MPSCICCSGANRLAPDVFAEAKCGTIQIGMFGANGAAAMETVTCYRTGMGDLRIRIPIARQMDIRTIAVPLPKIAAEGRLDGITVQTGATLHAAAGNSEVRGLPDGQWAMAGFTLIGDCYRASNEDACLLITVDPLQDAFAVFSLAVTSFSNTRVLATQSKDAVPDQLAALLKRGTAAAGQQ